MTRRASIERSCRWCRGRIRETARVDAIYCRVRCRQAANRASIRRLELEATTRPLRLAYADPPYVGLARKYYGGEASFAGEVDHSELVSRLARYDGWALSCSSRSVPAIAALLVAGGLEARLAVWVRRPAPHASARLMTAWEGVFFSPARTVVGGPPRRVLDVLVGVEGRPRPTLPTSVIGMKPPAFCEWVFQLLGAAPGDTLDDLYPGSGMVAWAWQQYTGGVAGADASLTAAADASRRAAAAGDGKGSFGGGQHV